MILTAICSDTQQIITADTNLGYNALSQVTVGASVKPSFTFKVLGGGTGTADYIEYNGEKRYETNSTIDVVAGDVVLVYNGGTPTIYYVNGTTVSVSSPYSFTMPYGNVSVLFERIYGTGYSTIQTSVLPEGEIIIDESGTYNVVNYASAQVTYPQSATGVSF